MLRVILSNGQYGSLMRNGASKFNDIKEVIYIYTTPLFYYSFPFVYIVDR